MRFLLISQGSLNPKIRFLGQKVCPVAREQTDTKVTTVGTLSWFQEFFLQPIIKDRPKKKKKKNTSPCKIRTYLVKQPWLNTI